MNALAVVNSNLAVPYGYCHCGCGNTTSPVRENDYIRGIAKGEPGWFLRGHRIPKWKSGRTTDPKFIGTHGSWVKMHQRTKPNWHFSQNYAERGITVCDRWQNFDNFYEDMGPRPEGMTLDRIDNDKGYEPSNCRWATPTEQCINRRMTVWVTIEGKTLPCSEWGKRNGLNKATICQRIKRGWTPEDAVTVPVGGDRP